MDDRQKWDREEQQWRGRIEAKMDALKDAIGDIKKGSQKTIYALIALAGAGLGVKFIGSPVWVILSSYFAWLSGLFLLAYTIGQWKHTYWQDKLVRLSFSAFLLFAITVRTFIYEAGVEPAPFWYAPINNALFTYLAIILIITTWRHCGRFKGE